MEVKKEHRLEMRVHIGIKTFITDMLLTIAICTLVAFAITMIGSSKDFLVTLLISQSFGVAICTTILAMLWIFNPRNWVSLLCVSVAAVFTGAVSGLYLGFMILKNFFHVILNWPTDVILRTVAFALITSIGVLYFFITRSILKHDKEQIEQERIKTVALQKEALEINLRMLQAQIEPHFLFNTLSNVVSLIDTDPARGKAMLLDLTRYLRTSLSRTLPEKTTLAQEAEMIGAYLNIQKIRMGERLNFTMDVPDDLRGKPFPPMLLQPLVENAVKHGLEPKIEGGGISIRATCDAHRLKVEVADTGLGISSLNANGIGMANVRDRLRLLFGDQGKFIVEENSPSGVRAVIEVPAHD